MASSIHFNINAAPVHKQVLDGLRRAIISGDLKPGEKLREAALSASAGVSRTIVREALRQLEIEGLITATRNKGAMVRSLSLEEARDIYCIRAFLEGVTTRLFTQRASDEQVTRLERSVDATLVAYGSGNVKRILAARDAFYDELLAGAGSAVLAGTLRSLNARIAHWRAIPLSHPGRSKKRDQEVRRELKRLIRSIRARNVAAAEQAAREHVEGIAAEVMRLYEQDNLAQLPTGAPALRRRRNKSASH